MPKKFIKRFIPNEETIKNHKTLSIFGQVILAPNLWHLNKHSISGAFAVGLFFAFVPVPFQMALAAAGALLFQVNLPLSVALVWITNPLTMPPIFYFSYLVGTWILDTPMIDVEFSLTYEWLKTGFLAIWEPFLLGCFVCGVFFGSMGHIFSRLIWRYVVIKNWRNRQSKRQKKISNH